MQCFLNFSKYESVSEMNHSPIKNWDPYINLSAKPISSFNREPRYSSTIFGFKCEINKKLTFYKALHLWFSYLFIANLRQIVELYPLILFLDYGLFMIMIMQFESTRKEKIKLHWKSIFLVIHIVKYSSRYVSDYIMLSS